MAKDLTRSSNDWPWALDETCKGGGWYFWGGGNGLGWYNLGGQF